MDNKPIPIPHHPNYSITPSGDIYNKLGRLLKPRLRKKTGYYAVVLYNPKRTYQVHRLVGEMFILNPENKPQINHKDGDKYNNHKGNLEWTTHGENQLHSYKELGRQPTYGKSNLCVKLKAIKEDKVQEFDSFNEAIEITGFSRQLIKNLINQSRKDPDGFSWCKI